MAFNRLRSGKLSGTNRTIYVVERLSENYSLLERKTFTRKDRAIKALKTMGRKK